MILVIGITALINVLLFAGLPWLTRVADRERTVKKVNLTLLTPRRPPKPPETEQERRLRREELKRAPKPKTQTRTSRRQTNVPKFGFEFGEGGFGNGIFVEFDAAGLGLNMEDFGFDVSQVDKAPRYLRRILPVYPFSAKRRGLRGWVRISCLVTKEGLPTKIAAVEAEHVARIDVDAAGRARPLPRRLRQGRRLNGCGSALRRKERWDGHRAAVRGGLPPALSLRRS